MLAFGGSLTQGMDRSCIQTFVTVSLIAAGVFGLLALNTKQMSSEQGAMLRIPEALKFKPQSSDYSYMVFGRLSWASTPWGKACLGKAEAAGDQLTAGDTAPTGICKLPSVWLNCSQGIYIDVGTNVGTQLRKLYDPWQFPGARVHELFNQTYGTGNRSNVCAIGIEANAVHTPYLAKLNQYFQRKGYQALVLTDTAASIRTGSAVFHLDHGNPVEWGASLSAGSWQGHSDTISNNATVTLFDLPAFLADIVRPLVRQVQQATGVRPPIGMKLDVEGEEYALLPAMITNGGLCDLSMIYAEVHPVDMRSESGLAVNMTVADMEAAFEHMRKANPRCTVRYTHMDDETYLRSHTEVALPP